MDAERILLDTLVTGSPTIAAFAGIYLLFRILNDFDLTVDGSFTTGAAVTAVAITNGVPAPAALVLAVLAGGSLGIVSAALHLVLRIPLLLAGLVMSLALFSINLRVMDTPTVSLVRYDTLFSSFDTMERVPRDLATIGVLGVVTALALGALAYFLRTEIGLGLRAMGTNPLMARAQGVNTRWVLILTLIIANGLTALSGSLLAQQQRFVEVNMGAGTLLAGAAGILLGELIFNPSSSQVVRAVVAVAVGTLLYRLILVFSLHAGLPATDLKLVTAATLVGAIGLQLATTSTRRRWAALGGRLRALRQTPAPGA